MGRNNEYNDEPIESDSILDDDQDDQEPELELGPEDWHDWNSEHVLNMWMSLRQYLEDNHLQHALLSKATFHNFAEFVRIFSQ